MYWNKIILALMLNNVMLTSVPLASAPLLPVPDPACVPGVSTSPPWLAELGQAAAQFTQHTWYKNWFQTTTNLCTDLSRIEKLNPLRAPVIWRSDTTPLFAYTYSTQKQFEAGLVPAGTPEQLIYQEGVGQGNSAYIYATYDPHTAFTSYMDTGEPVPGTVYILDAPGGIDRDARSEAEPGHHGVLFPGGIKSAFIKGALITRQAPDGVNVVTTYEPNPYNTSTRPSAQEFDLIVSPFSGNNVNVFPQAHISVNPKGQPSGHGTFRYQKGTRITLSMVNGAHECWYINGYQKTMKTSQFVLDEKSETSPLLVVYSGPCHEKG